MEKHIIILEDDPFLKEFYNLVFRKLGAKITILEDGDMFYDILQHQNVSLILMDINLRNTYFMSRKVDGIFLSKLVKKDPRFNFIPVVLVTAYALNKTNTKMFIESGANDYFVKPITDINLFLTKIKSLMEESWIKTVS
jgi:CheY-like chemotaxis protein